MEINIINNRYEIENLISDGMGARSFEGVDLENNKPVFMKER